MAKGTKLSKQGKNQARVFGYARISTKKQNIERQVRNITAEYPNAIIIREVFTGTSINRPEFENLLKQVKRGDTIVFDSVSRMSRKADEGFALYKELYSKGIDLVFLKEHHIDTFTYKREMEKQININVSTGNEELDTLTQSIFDALNIFMLHVAQKQIALAFEQSQKEVDDMRQRTCEGIETARRAGKQIGGHKAGVKLIIKKEAPVKALILKHSKSFDGILKDLDVIAIINATQGLHVAHNTYYKYKRELAYEAIAH